MWDDLVRAIALVLVIEGMMPFLSPDGGRQAMLQASRFLNKTLRIIGFSSMLIGVLVLYLSR
ncbi:MAG: DUF2065 domain-containing protein [Gammaproteobacteria bacterium]|jgi:uncharacterized protein YjeT (DUF2065 family)|nr:DUF2065 domain-containing protein [Gammaproteobacteria bacterium]